MAHAKLSVTATAAGCFLLTERTPSKSFLSSSYPLHLKPNRLGSDPIFSSRAKWNFHDGLYHQRTQRFLEYWTAVLAKYCQKSFHAFRKREVIPILQVFISQLSLVADLPVLSLICSQSAR